VKNLIIISVLIVLSSCNENSQNQDSENDHSDQQHESVKTYSIDSLNTLADLLELSIEESKTPILYFHSEKCQPCIEFKESLDDELVVRAFENGILMEVDIMNDPQDLKSLYSVYSVPTLMKIDVDSNEIRRITSLAWGDGKPENIAPVVDTLINYDFNDSPE